MMNDENNKNRMRVMMISYDNKEYDIKWVMFKTKKRISDGPNLYFP